MTQTYFPYILLIDDDSEDIELFQEAMKIVSPGTELKHALSCSIALNILTDPSGAVPNVIFMDLVMHETDGFECIRLIKQDPALTDIPIVVLSSSINDHYLDNLYDLGVSYFITKPPSFKELSSVLNKVVNNPSIFDDHSKDSFHIKEYV